MTIVSGCVNITERYEGIEGQHVAILGGEITLTATDDGLNAAGGMDGSGFGRRSDTFTQSGETPSIVISGGTFIGTGATGMAQSFSNSTQGVISANVGTQSAGTKITLTDGSGTVILSHTDLMGKRILGAELLCKQHKALSVPGTVISQRVQNPYRFRMTQIGS